MRTRNKAYIVAGPLILLLASLGVMTYARLYINLTASLPRGVYRLYPQKQILRGDVVLVIDLDDIGINRSLCPQRGMLKIAAALSGDVIGSDGRSIFINGGRLDYSDIFKLDKYGKALPHQTYPYAVPSGCVYLASTHLHGYDSRYFGPVSLSHVAGVAEMVLSFE